MTTYSNDNSVDFTKKVYRLDWEKFHIEEQTLERVVMQGADETTSPRGVEPKYFVEEGKMGWELRYWLVSGKSSFINAYNTEEEAMAARLQTIYDNDFIDSEWSYKWFDSIDEAVADYVDLMDGEDEPVTAEEVKAKIAATEAEIKEDIQRYADNLSVDVKKAYEVFLANGQVSKKGKKLASNVVSGYYRHSDFWDVIADTKTLVSDETYAKAREMYMASRNPETQRFIPSETRI